MPVVFGMLDGLWEELPYVPWVRPGVAAECYSDGLPGDRRVVGRLDGRVVCVTDLPAHFELPGDSGFGHQWFSRAGEFVDWVVQTCARTRFCGDACGWGEADRFEVALGATLFGLTWDLDGNVLVNNETPASVSTRVVSYRLQVDGFGAWRIVDADGRELTVAEAGMVVGQQLFDVGQGTPPLGFQTEVPATA